MKFLVLTLEFKPRDEALAWANRVAGQHADHRIIVVTHGYLTKDGRRADPTDTRSRATRDKQSGRSSSAATRTSFSCSRDMPGRAG